MVFNVVAMLWFRFFYSSLKCKTVCHIYEFLCNHKTVCKTLNEYYLCWICSVCVSPRMDERKKKSATTTWNRLFKWKVRKIRRNKLQVRVLHRENDTLFVSENEIKMQKESMNRVCVCALCIYCPFTLTSYRIECGLLMLLCAFWSSYCVAFSKKYI